MRWRAICERRFERVIGDRTGFVPLDSNTDQPLDGPPGPAVSPIAQLLPLRRPWWSLKLLSFLANPADKAESAASSLQQGATFSHDAPRLRQNEASMRNQYCLASSDPGSSRPFRRGGGGGARAPPRPAASPSALCLTATTRPARGERPFHTAVELYPGGAWGRGAWPALF